MGLKKRNKRQRRRQVRNEIDRIKKQLAEQDSLIIHLLKNQELQVQLVAALVKNAVP